MLVMLQQTLTEDIQLNNGAAIVSGPEISPIAGILHLSSKIESVNMRAIFEDLQKMIVYYNEVKGAHTNIGEITKHRILLLEQKINRVKNFSCKRWISQAETELQMKNINRRKRGLFNFGGSVTKGIFDEATEGDITDLSTKIELENTITIDFMKNSLQIVKNITEKATAAIKQNTNYVNQVNKLEENLEDYLEISYFLEELEKECNELSNIINENGISQLKLTSIDFPKILNEIEKTKDAWGLLPIFNINDPQTFLDVNDLTIRKINFQEYEIVLSIPFIKRESFTSKLIYAVPMFHENATEYKLAPIINYPLVIQSHDTRYFSLQNLDYLNSCYQLSNSKRICRQFVTYDNSNTKSLPCEIQLTQRYNITNCQFHKMKAITSVLELTSTTLVSGTPDDILYIHCPTLKNINNRFTIPSTGVVAVSKKCSFSSKSLSFNHVLTHSSDLAFFLPKILPNHTLSINTTHKIYNNVDQIQADIVNLETNLKQNKHIKLLYTYSHAQSIALVAILFVGLIIICIVMIKCK